MTQITVGQETYEKLVKKKALHQAKNPTLRITWDLFLLEKVDC